MDSAGRGERHPNSDGVQMVAVVLGDSEADPRQSVLRTLADYPDAALALAAEGASAFEAFGSAADADASRFAVESAVDGAQIKANCVYLYDASQPLGVESGHFALLRPSDRLSRERLLELLCETAELAGAAPTFASALMQVSRKVADGLGWQVVTWRLVDDAPVTARGDNMPDGPSLRVRLPVHCGRQLVASVDFAPVPPGLPDETLRTVFARVGRQLAQVAERDRHTERLLAQQADRARIGRILSMGEVASSLAHELSQPLSAVSNYSGALQRLLERDHTDPATLADVAARLGAQTVRAGNVLQSLKQFVVRQRVYREAVEPAGLLLQLSASMRNEFANERIAAECVVDGDLPLVYTDAAYLEQILLNLLTNAVDALREKPFDDRQLRLSASHRSGKVLISVSDNGDGIALEAQAYVFDAFFTTRRHGIGMGLTVSRSLTEALGGKIWFASERGRGTTFTLAVPT